MRIGTLVTKKATAFAVVLALAFAAAAFTTHAYASDTPYNNNVEVTAKANDPTFDNNAQYIDVTMEFAYGAPVVSAADMETYLEANTTIAGRTIAADDDGYTRDVSNVSISGNVVSFKIGPNSDGMTANYSGELYIEANPEDNAFVSLAMGNAPVETLIDNGLTFSKVSGTAAASTFSVDTRAQARGMNHILIVNGTGADAVAIFSGTGTFENGGITVHSHSFMDQTVADYAAALVSAGNGENTNWVFTDLGNGQFSISNSDPTVDCSNLHVYLYACDYLNDHGLSVGDIYEHELDADGNPIN